LSGGGRGGRTGGDLSRLRGSGKGEEAGDGGGKNDFIHGKNGWKNSGLISHVFKANAWSFSFYRIWDLIS
jgi:hypothetical protein